MGWLRSGSPPACETSRNARRISAVAVGEHGGAGETATAPAAEHVQQPHADLGREDAREVFVDSEAASRPHHVRFIDRLQLDVAAGRGGKGCVSFVKSTSRGACSRHVLGRKLVPLRVAPLWSSS